MIKSTLSNLDVQTLRAPGEKKALRRTMVAMTIVYLACIGLTLSFFLLWLGIAVLTVRVLRSRYLSEAVEVGPDQLPDLWDVVKRCSSALKVPTPRVFVSVDPGNWPIYTVPVPEPAILMHANWVKSLSPDELTFFVCHELAHGKLGHRPLLNPINVLENVGPISWILTTPLEMMRYAMRPWSRLAEFSADRVALACVDGRLEIAAGALGRVTLGEEIFDRLSVPAYLSQARMLSGGRLLALYEIVTGRLGTASRLAQLVTFTHSPEYVALESACLGLRDSGTMPAVVRTDLA